MERDAEVEERAPPLEVIDVVIIDRRTYAAIGMWPDGGAYNLWRGFAVEPKPGDCTLYLDHWRDVVCAGDREHYRWALAWMAQAVQRRAEKPGTAIVMRGGEGVGKGTAAQGFGRLFGQHFVHVTSTRMVTGNSTLVRGAAKATGRVARGVEGKVGDG